MMMKKLSVLVCRVTALMADGMLLLRLGYDRLLPRVHGVSVTVPLLHPYDLWWGQDKRRLYHSFTIGADRVTATVNSRSQRTT